MALGAKASHRPHRVLTPRAFCRSSAPTAKRASHRRQTLRSWVANASKYRSSSRIVSQIGSSPAPMVLPFQLTRGVRMWQTSRSFKSATLDRRHGVAIERQGRGSMPSHAGRAGHNSHTKETHDKGRYVALSPVLMYMGAVRVHHTSIGGAVKNPFFLARTVLQIGSKNSGALARMASQRDHPQRRRGQPDRLRVTSFRRDQPNRSIPTRPRCAALVAPLALPPSLPWRQICSACVLHAQRMPGCREGRASRGAAIH